MTTPMASLALEGGDPRDPHHPITGNAKAVELAMLSSIHDPSITFEEYIYWAEITRAEEKIANEKFIAAQGPKNWKTPIINRFSRAKAVPESYDSPPATTLAANEKEGLDEKPVVPGGSDHSAVLARPSAVSDAEWKTASRAVRTAGWSGVFYLITTDILGPFSVPWAFAQMGYGPGVALYTVFGIFALYSGWQIFNIFLALDSDRYPTKSYGDLFFRVFGTWARHGINIAQSIQLLFTVSILILSNGQSIAQISKGNLCFVVCLVIFMAAGMVLGQIRTLQRFGWLANFAVWINVLIIFICMGVVANSAPNYTTIEASFGDTFGPGPVHRYAGTPPAGKATGGDGFVGSLNGLNQAVYSYGGAMLFVAFLAEMRHPMDFWKGLICADLFIYFVYMFFGIFVYSYQGQYSYNPVIQGLSPYNWQTAANIMNLITGLIAAVLYGNIGIKVAYIDVIQGIFKAPPLTSKPGKLIWIGMVPLYWAIAFCVCAAIPQFSYISGLVGALCILQFTYTFPAILGFGYQIQKDAMLPDEESFDPQTGTYSYFDRGVKRWIRGFKVHWLFNIFNFFYFLGALTTAALGIYTSCLGLISAFDGTSAATSFGCTSPV
ncbi:putative N amino acid transport system protein [Sclerotinia borealis F-4128]|uniref:Putative N amino acid transport system protein n=1 Tax=Sclerotinia borealis (strain F-4128) TaxID=1432307 RepID=W9CGI6_SCLBF|nr:putative N amino acid transport system protein [Sclerotinia borealis F-4128]